MAAVKSHLNNMYFAHLDIKHFFNHVSRSRVTRALVPYFGYETSRVVACNSTVCLPNSTDYFLPYGFVQSPMLASLCLHKSMLGRHLANLNKRDDVVVSVYVDDIIVSSCDLKALSSLVDELCAIAEKSKFPINGSKLRPAAPQTISFNIELNHRALKITEERLERFRDAVGISEHLPQILGIVNYVGTINTGQRDELRRIAGI